MNTFSSLKNLSDVIRWYLGEILTSIYRRYARLIGLNNYTISVTIFTLDLRDCWPPKHVNNTMEFNNDGTWNGAGPAHEMANFSDACTSHWTRLIGSNNHTKSVTIFTLDLRDCWPPKHVNNTMEFNNDGTWNGAGPAHKVANFSEACTSHWPRYSVVPKHD